MLLEKIQSCNLCKYNQNYFYPAKVIKRNNSNKYLYFIFEWAYNYELFIKHYINQLQNFNIIVVHAINCAIDEVPKIKEINTCKNILQYYIENYPPEIIIALGTVVMQSLHRIDKIKDYDEKNVDFEIIYTWKNNIPIYLTYSPLVYTKSKNQDILMHIHNKIEEATNTQLEIYQYINQNIINANIETIKELEYRDLTEDIDLNDYDIALAQSNKENTIFTLFKKDSGIKFLICNNINITDKIPKNINIKKQNFSAFKKIKKYLSTDKTLNDSLRKISNYIGIPLNVYTFPSNELATYSYITNKAKNRTFNKIPYLICDIEVYSDNNVFPDPNIAQHQVICLSIYQNNQYYTYYIKTDKEIKNKDYIAFDTEKEMLYYVFKEHISKALILYGWNAYFDFVYLYNRAYNLGINVLTEIYNLPETLNVSLKFANNFQDKNICYSPIFDIHDLMDLYKTYVDNKLPSYALNYVAKTELNQEKIKLEDSISNMWKKDPEKIIYYNTIDVKITTEIFKKYKFYEFFDTIRQILNMPFNFRYFTPTVFGKMVMYNALIQNNMISTYTIDNKSAFSINYTGAYVQQSVPKLIVAKK